MLHDVTMEKAIIRKEKRLEDDGDDEVIFKIEVAANSRISWYDDGDDEVIFKIEVAANRYDLLCLEGLARALLVFTGTEASLVFKLSSIPRASMLQMYVKPQRPVRVHTCGCHHAWGLLGCEEPPTLALFSCSVITVVMQNTSIWSFFMAIEPFIQGVKAKWRLEHHACLSVSPNSTSLQLLRIEEELGNAVSWR
ncbi:hypothetical protein ACP70R_026851 [Stipagrostis hirtigluma subsp. patula]